MATQWGRKETVVWPPHAPVYTYGAVMLAFLCTGAFLWAAFAAETPLQQFYTPAYLKSAVVGEFKKQDKYRLLYLGNSQNQSRIATAADVAQGSTPTPDGKVLPLAPATKMNLYTAISRARSSRVMDSGTFTATSFGTACWRSAPCSLIPSSAT